MQVLHNMVSHCYIYFFEPEQSDYDDQVVNSQKLNLIVSIMFSQ